MKDKSIYNYKQLPAAAAQHELTDLVTLINDDITLGLRDHYSDNLIVQRAVQREDIGHHICIELAGEQVAIPLSAVLEAGELQVLQPLPLLPDWLAGITNIRGEIISVVDLGVFIGHRKKTLAHAPPYIVVHHDEITIVLIVDGIYGTRSLYRPLTEQSDKGARENQVKKYFTGSAVYRKDDREIEISLFNLNGFLSSSKLRNVATA